MKEQHKCSECGKPFWTSMIKVFVFKQRFCSKDKMVLNVSPDFQTFTCPKCGTVYKKDNSLTFANLGVSITGSTRDFVKAEKEKATGNVEIEKVMIQENLMDQRCRNYQNRFNQASQKREKKLAMGVSDDIHEIPASITDRDIYKYEIIKKTQEDYRETQKQKAIAEREAQMKLDRENAAKAKLVEDLSNKLQVPPPAPSPIPLIDPETRKLIEKAKRKDARIKKLIEQQEKEKQKIEEAKIQ